MQLLQPVMQDVLRMGSADSVGGLERPYACLHQRLCGLLNRAHAWAALGIGGSAAQIVAMATWQRQILDSAAAAPAKTLRARVSLVDAITRDVAGDAASQ